MRGASRAFNILNNPGIQNYIASINYLGNQNLATDFIAEAGGLIINDPNDQSQEGFIINGPPGTGKTFVLDVGALRYLTNQDRLRRGNSRASQVAIATFTHSAADRIVEQFDEIFEIIGLTQIERRQIITRVHPNNRPLDINPLIQNYTAYATKPSDTSDQEWTQIRNQIDASRIFVSTIYQIGTIMNASDAPYRLKPVQASLLLVDEASQINISKLNIAYSKAGNKLKTIGLIGDRYQLQPISRMTDLQEDVISYMRTNNRINRQTQLNYQFRMHPTIRRLAQSFGRYDPIQDARVTLTRDLGTYLYDPRVQTISSANIVDEILKIDNRIVILDTSTNSSWVDTQIGSSRINPTESEAIDNLNQLFLRYYDGLIPDQILTVVPYSFQARFIDETYARVGTVDRFQGQEGDLVVGGTVKTEEGSVDHIANENRMNVMVSRARAKLVLFNHRDTFVGNSIFDTLYNYMGTQNGCMVIPYTDDLHIDIKQLLQ